MIYSISNKDITVYFSFDTMLHYFTIFLTNFIILFPFIDFFDVGYYNNFIDLRNFDSVFNFKIQLYLFISIKEFFHKDFFHIFILTFFYVFYSNVILRFLLSFFVILVYTCDVEAYPSTSLILHTSYFISICLIIWYI